MLYLIKSTWMVDSIGIFFGSTRLGSARLGLKNARGFSIVEILVSLGIMSIVAMGMATFLSNQANEIKSLDEKMSMQGLQNQISNVLTSPAFCGCLMGTNTFNYTTTAWNTFPTSIGSSYNGSCTAVGGALLTVGSNIGNSNLKPTSMAMQNITETTAGSGNFSANLVLQFDSTLLTRSRKPLSIPMYFKVNMANPVAARTLSSCGASGSGDLWKQNFDGTIYFDSANVGIGTPAPGAGTMLLVTGQIVSASTSVATGAIDFKNGNSITTSFDCGSALSFANLVNGGSYSLVVTGPGTTTCSFSTTTTGDSAGTVNYRFMPANTTRTPNSHTVYSLFRVGSIVYVAWQTGY